MGEVLLKHKLPRELAGDVQVISAGTHAYDGLPASTHAQIVARQVEVDLTEDRPRLGVAAPGADDDLQPRLVRRMQRSPVARRDVMLRIEQRAVLILRWRIPSQAMKTFIFASLANSTKKPIEFSPT